MNQTSSSFFPNEVSCLSEQCKKITPKKVAKDCSTCGLPHTEQPSYSFENWEVSQENKQWLIDHPQTVSVLTVSLANWSGQGHVRVNLDRRTTLYNALDEWSNQGWSILLFVPLGNKEQYTECAKIQSVYKTVRMVPYIIQRGTCNFQMNVGESRNALLHFADRFSNEIRSMVVADERVLNIERPAPSGALDRTRGGGGEPNRIKAQRIQEGHDRLFALKQFLSDGPTDTVRAFFKSKQVESDIFWKKEPDSSLYFRSHVPIYDESVQKCSMWHELVKQNPSLVGIPTGYRWRMRKTPLTVQMKKIYKRWESLFQSGGTKLGGADVSAIAPTDYTQITQLIALKIGGQNGWTVDTGVWYPYTTMGEDNYFSYEWSQQIGPVRQLDAIVMSRPMESQSLTRTYDDVSSYTDCALRALVSLLESKTYHLGRLGIVPLLLWVNDGNTESNRMSQDCYKRQVFVLSQVAYVCKKRSIPISTRAKLCSETFLRYCLERYNKKGDDSRFYKACHKKTDGDLYERLMKIYQKSGETYIKNEMKLSIPTDG